MTIGRVGGKVRQRTLLNLGRHFPLPRAQWPEFCERVEQILSGQLPLLEADPEVEELAQHGAARLVAREWSRQLAEGSRASHPGVCCLRASRTDFDEQSLWRTYPMLTDLEAVFRSLKSELGLRPGRHPQAGDRAMKTG